MPQNWQHPALWATLQWGGGSVRKWGVPQGGNEQGQGHGGEMGKVAQRCLEWARPGGEQSPDGGQS